LVGIGAVLAAIGLAGTLIRLPYATFSPGAALDLAPLVKVHGAPSYSDSGDVMLLFVRERDHVNVWSWLQAKLDPDIDIARQDLVNGGSSQEESNAAAISDMAQSQVSAKAAALTALGHRLKTAPGLLVTAVLPSKPAGKALRPGDQLLTADGQVLKVPGDLSKIVERHRLGTSVRLRLVRGGRTQTVPVAVYSDARAKARRIGVFAMQTFRFPVRIDVDTRNISGPSAGLAMTLAIIDRLSPGDLAGGKRVAVTGTITADGKVGEIGAIQQKAISAKAAHAQIFIVPACGDDRVCSKDLQRLKQRVGKSVDVEPVATLAQALRVLREAGGAPVRTGSTTSTT
jgi:PDZ domain-containing protein